MRKYLLLIGLCASIFQVYARSNPSRIEKKSFPDIGEVRFEHSYGNITVTESDSKQVELEIRYFDKEEFKPVCETSVSGNVLAIKTVYHFQQGQWKFLSAGREDARIDYIIAVPKNVAMKVNLDFGNLNSNTFFISPIHITSNHSDLTMNKVETLVLSANFTNVNINTADMLDVQSKHSNYKIGEVKTVKADYAFVNINIDSVDDFDIQSKHSNYKIGKVKTLKANCSFGHLNIDSVDEFDAELRHTPVNIENLNRKLNIRCSFSNVTIRESPKQLELIKFSGSHSTMKVRLDPDLSADLDADLKYGNLSVDDKYNVKYSLSEKSYNRIIKKGTIGGKTPTAKIDVRNSYGNISIK